MFNKYVTLRGSPNARFNQTVTRDSFEQFLPVLAGAPFWPVFERNSFYFRSNKYLGALIASNYPVY